MDCKNDYPTVATVTDASMATLTDWDKTLPAPTNDVQRTVRRKITARLLELAGQAVRDQAPSIAERFNDIADMVEKITGKKQARL